MAPNVSISAMLAGRSFQKAENAQKRSKTLAALLADAQSRLAGKWGARCKLCS